MKLYISPQGCDKNSGTREKPLATLQAARNAIRRTNCAGTEPVCVVLLKGSYFMDQPLVLTPEDSGSVHCPVSYEAEGDVTVSGGMPLHLDWQAGENGIYYAAVPEHRKFDQLFADGQRQIMARYPSYNPEARYFHGFAADSFAPERVKKYKDPAGGFMHVMHTGLWGGFQYEITGMDENGNLQYRGGHQNNRPSPMHPQIRYIENIREELTEPGEWYLDTRQWVLYYKPLPGRDIRLSTFSGAVCKNLITFRGTPEQPVHHLIIRGIRFENTGRTFMEPMEPLLRSDWCVYRGGAVYLENTENITLENCDFRQLGGNGIFISRYNRNALVQRCFLYEAGGSGILLVGDPSAVRNPLFRYENSIEDLAGADMEPGPRSEAYPRDCRICDNLIVRSGETEKQTAGVCISMSRRITVSHNTIYDVPRAGINICDGTWGGHCICYNMVFDTVKETSDHGAFNSWGRDRFWDYRYEKMEEILEQNPDFPLLDAVEPNRMHHNCFQCAHGWDIDLDDGSSNYLIYDNLCLQGGLKNREGICREVFNNILLNNTFHPHVWFRNSRDRFCRNLLFKPYADIRLKGWGESMDDNLLCSSTEAGPALPLQKKSGMDGHSLYGRISFRDPVHGDFTVEETEEIKAIGFSQISTAQMGVQCPRLKAMARSPFGELCRMQEFREQKDRVLSFRGMQMKRLTTLGEQSATGMHTMTGLYIETVEENSEAWYMGLRPNDVIVEIDGEEARNPASAVKKMDSGFHSLTVWRDQQALTFTE